ncbi:MAG: DUF3369 domain-containing protein [Desulfobacteraceae bacterium]|nr:DUF3369 domain-containing protein [Desulfobacteraceae bacterium]
MDVKSNENPDDELVFVEEDSISEDAAAAFEKKALWKILIVDDEEDVHEITRITLKGYSFDNRGVQLLSAYSGDEVKEMLKKEHDIALILLDVVMEKDDTGLDLVEHIRKDLKNSTVRIVLRTGQPGKAPEQEVITKYDINDYKTKPEFTAQKLYTSVTACLRAYNNLKTIERNNQGLQSIIRSTAIIFKNQSFSRFASQVLIHLIELLRLDSNADISSAYLVGMPKNSIFIMSGTGRYADKIGMELGNSMPRNVVDYYLKFQKNGGETFLADEYIGVFKTREGFSSLLYLSGCADLRRTERHLLRIYANNIAIGFDNISLAREIINTQKEVILTLGEIVETRSQETANHVTRVAEACYLLANKYGMDENTTEMLRLASPMHDVGKIGVPEAILNKPGRLTDVEFEIIKHHAETGYEILRKSNRPIMQTAAIVALQHHERWDGMGYPQGLSGENIHIFGRIAAIADVFDALSHKRCYKEAWSIEKIIDYYKSESGNHFDANLVTLFLMHVDEFVSINKIFPD